MDSVVAVVHDPRELCIIRHYIHISITYCVIRDTALCADYCGEGLDTSYNFVVICWLAAATPGWYS